MPTNRRTNDSNFLIRIAFLGLILSAAPATFGQSWISPTSSVDPEGVWATPSSAFYGDTSTYASDTSNRSGYGGYLIFNLNSQINCGRVRINADFGYGIVDPDFLDDE